MEADLTRVEAAELARLSSRTIDRLIHNGVLPAYRVAGTRSIRIKRADVEALLVPANGDAA